MTYVFERHNAWDRTLLGAKAAALAQLEQAGQPVPSWFVVSPDAFVASLPRGVLESASQQVLPMRPHPEVEREIAAKLATLCPRGERVAVRSSAQEEDGERCSFAGQLDSFLFVRPQRVAETVAQVWRSAFSERVLAYRRERGLHGLPSAPAVLVQRMVHADAAGVAFSAHPIGGRREVAVVSAVFGIGAELVDGECDADTYYVDRAGRIIGQQIAEKRWACRAAAGDGWQRVELAGDLRRRPALDPGQVRAVAELAWRCERLAGSPQDIEWAIEEGRVFLLQSRPITTLAPEGQLALWDNSNIAESYSGITTPLTFSYIRRNYACAYRELCRLGGVSEARLRDHDDVFHRMLGLIRGRVYYNLLSWYRLLALIPGFHANRRFLDQMLGVDPASADAIAETAPSGRHPLITSVRAVRAIVGHHFLLTTRIRRFQARLDRALAEPQPPLQERRADELAAYFRDLDRHLLNQWDAPLLNDFFAMIFHGLLRRLVAAWFDAADSGLANSLLCDEPGMISVEPAERVHEMASLAAAQPALVELLCCGSLEAVLQRLPAWPAFAERYEAYLARFGDRCHQELKLESATLRDDPLPLLRAVGAAARGPKTAIAPARALRQQAERRVRAVLKPRPLRHALFRWVLANARARLRERENLRFSRTRIFGRARRTFVELGRRFHAAQVLNAPGDIFYLELEEILGFVEGTTSCTDLRGLAALRRAEFARYRAEPAPPDRFETRGAAHLVPMPSAIADRAGLAGEQVRCGRACGPGVARGAVQVVADPNRTSVRQGTILVAERTDPGWVMLFPLAAGLVVERGNLLSHAAIVAREMGIPAVFGLDGACRWLKDGDWVEVDGHQGTVRRISAPQAERPA